jgi:predicted PurR-regulated permease PerM
MLMGYFSSCELTRTTLAVLFIGALIVSTAWIVRPFLSATLWTSMIVISTWPLLRRWKAKLGEQADGNPNSGIESLCTRH